jgi:CSLREA domain-containing protein
MALVAIVARSAHADNVFNVNTVADLIDDNTTDGSCHTNAGTCSLRAAIMQSNHPAVGVTVINLPAGIYKITRPADPVDDETVGNFDFNLPGGPGEVIILGAGAEHTIVDGNTMDNVFHVNAPRTVTIDGITIRNGATLTTGGGISSEGILTVSHCVIENNGASIFGGGIYVGGSSSSSLVLSQTTLRSNLAGNGGGIYSSSDVVMHNSALYGNTASDSGGALYANGSLTVTNTTISGNVANTSGAGIYSRTAAFLYSASIVGNDADHDRDEILGGVGGGVYADAGSRFVAVNTLFALNTILDAPIPDNCNGTLEVYGKNLFDDVSGCIFSGNGGIATGAVSPGTIGALQNNGGTTLTHALLEGSEAIDASTSQGCIDEGATLLMTDQRGEARVFGDRCDIGAYERGALADVIFANGFD